MIPEPHVRLADFCISVKEAPPQASADGAVRLLKDLMHQTELKYGVYTKEAQMHVPCFSNWNTVPDMENIYYYSFRKHIVFVRECGCIFIYEKPEIIILSFLWYKKHAENLFLQKPSQRTKDLWEGTPTIVRKMKLEPG